jgi:tetratricopeptide (TPR) repeat protein
MVLGIWASVPAQAADPVNAPAGTSNQVVLARLRQIAVEQKTNVSAWVDYGKASWKDLTDEMEKTGETPSTNAFENALSAFQEASRLDPKNHKIHRQIADIYSLRAWRKIFDKDPTRYGDLDMVLYHSSLALSNAPTPAERRHFEQQIALIKSRIASEQDVDLQMELIKRKYGQGDEGNAPRTPEQVAGEFLKQMRTRAQNEPENPGALLDYGKMLMAVEYQGLRNTNALAEAQGVFLKAISVDKHNGSAYEWLGRCFDLQGDKTNALINYKKAVEEGRRAQLIRARIESIEQDFKQ